MSTTFLIQLLVSIILLMSICCLGTIPYSMATWFASTLGMIFLFFILVACILYAKTPIIPILFSIFAWQLVHQSMKQMDSMGATLQFTPTNHEHTRTKYMQSMTPIPERTLEEEMVAKVTPTSGQSPSLETSFAPIAENIHNAFSLSSS
jgi:hypothetical protein